MRAQQRYQLAGEGMTTLFDREAICFVCGARSTHRVIGSTNSFGSPDLDLRPPPMKRDTMAYWVQSCPSCGYCASEIDEGPEIARAVVRSPEYISQVGAPSYPPLARQFLCFALILAADGEEAGAGQASLHAAWACDDGQADAQAEACRLKAIALLTSAREKERWLPNDRASASLLQADLHRRAGNFGHVASACEEGLAADPEEPVRSLLLIQRRLAMRGDRNAYTIQQALEQQGSADGRPG
jgi:hypothetical protein